MWYGHHPFFLFLIPGLISEKFEKEKAKKQVRTEQAIQRSADLQNTDERDIKSRIAKWREFCQQKSKEAKPNYIKLGLSTLFFFICLLVEEGSIILKIFLLPAVIGIIIFGVKSFCYYSELESASNAICELENELARRNKEQPLRN